MSEVILKLSNLRKIYITGNLRTAKKALEEIQKLSVTYEKLADKDKNNKNLKEYEKLLNNAHKLFYEEKFEECYTSLTQKIITRGPRNTGVVIHALNGINLEIKQGEMVAIIGPSGSGKTTLLSMLGLHDTPTTGQIYLRGKKISSIKSSKLPDIRSKELGFVFQSFDLIPTMTALENVVLPLKYSKAPAKERDALAEEALELVGMSNRLYHTPNQLSGGQKQRVAIARAIVNKPAIIFGDELTGELDIKTTKEIMQLVTKLNKQGQTFVIVTHNPEVAKFCQRTIMIVDGRVARTL
ncbi:macrolide ABC transporter ATP-binding protein [Candidatus Saccharibacteria bacterium CG11_big_fil_rev_8_21_14_0_20_41_19]|nr:ABC transporter ATP-binding protein [Candidatus Saccharibacteria bacterium]PIQ71145.1 MAG: macrolide ABC transporter ATP-binding protein [Candidatus Saccharibacteria bacterium CG11_big_fil_rev_8_21_14_0_20_41_19]PIZ59961.1 MAG: macrolide ABC transporter ATP-binding protein [Candidatus Saccharibacteria bacterium CG_4_10_14_0_2_um_filter_41_11]PJC29516.1 MAG: macrolide ABC transporter ATP-binding protein [Candidatus Saccharibacteria bacterium CG_4_9_14_0_2_um_filter_41_9]PJE65951.1 MAG: macrol